MESTDKERISADDLAKWIAKKKKVAASLKALKVDQAELEEMQEGLILDYGMSAKDNLEPSGVITRAVEAPEKGTL